MRSQDLATKEPAYFVIMQGPRAIVAVKDLARATDMLQGLKQQFPEQDFTVKIRQGHLSEERYRCAECGGAAVNIMADLEEAKKDACYYKVRSRYKVWPSAYASGALVQCRKKGASNWGTKAKKESLATSADVVDEQQDLASVVDDPSGKFDPINMQILVGAFLSKHKNHNNLQDNLPELIGKWLRNHAAELGTMGFSTRDYPRIQTLMHEIMDVDAVFEGEDLEENLRKWFKEKWVRFGPDGKIRGDCARGSEGEGKPKCLPQKKAYNLGKKGRASAAARKRRQDPDADRKGPAKNVATKKEGVAEMDKSQPSHGRDGKISHSTYGSRDKKGSDYFKGKEAPGKAITAKKASKDALDILKKQGVAEASSSRNSHDDYDLDSHTSFIPKGRISDLDFDLRHISHAQNFGALQDAFDGQFGPDTRKWLENQMMEIGQEHGLDYDDDKDQIIEILMSQLVEKYGVAEMDKSQPSHGRDGKISHSTYGSRDKKGSDYFKGKEAPGKAITAKKASKDALDILKKQGVAEETQPLDPRPTVLPPRKEIILFVDDAEVAVYDDLNDAVRDARRFAMKFPNYSIVLKRDVCTRTNLARIQEGQSLGDLQ